MSRERIDPRLLTLVDRMANADPPWSGPRIHDELRAQVPEFVAQPPHEPPPGRENLEERAAEIASRLAEGSEAAALIEGQIFQWKAELASHGGAHPTAELWDFLVRSLHGLGCASEAVAASVEALSHGVWSEEILLRSVGLILEGGGTQQASEFLRFGSSRVQESELIFELESRVLYELGKFDAATRAALKALEFDPSNGPATGIRLLVHLEQCDLHAATEVFAKSRADASELSWAVDRLIEELGQAGRDGLDLAALSLDVEGAIDRALAGREGREREWAHLRLLDLAGSRQKVLVLAERLTQQSTGSSTQECRRQRARCLLQLGRLGQGLEVFAELIEDPECDPATRTRYAEAVEFVSDFREAGLETSKGEVRSPEALFEWLVGREPAAVVEPETPASVALVGATLACGGAERVLATAYRALSGREEIHPQLWLYSVDPAQGHDFYQRNLGIGDDEIQILPPLRPTEAPLTLLPPQIGVRIYPLYRALREAKPAVVHAWQDSVCLEVGFAALLAGVPRIILHPHNLRPDSVHRTRWAHTYAACYRALLSSNRVHLLCVSDASIEDYEDWLGQDLGERGHVIGNGFEFALAKEQDPQDARRSSRQQFGLAEDAFVVGAAMRFAAVKRPLLWIETVAALRQSLPHLQAILFGDGELRPAMERRIAELGLQECLHLPGRVDDAPVAVAALDACLLTSETEGLPTTLIEAQVAGVPVVATHVGGTGECFADGETGILCDEHSPEVLSAALLCVAKDPSWRTRALAEGRPAALAKFGVEPMIDALVDLYAGP